MQENLLAARGPPKTPPEELAALPLVGRRLAAPPQKLQPALSLLGLGLRPIGPRP